MLFDFYMKTILWGVNNLTQLIQETIKRVNPCVQELVRTDSYQVNVKHLIICLNKLSASLNLPPLYVEEDQFYIDEKLLCRIMERHYEIAMVILTDIYSRVRHCNNIDLDAIEYELKYYSRTFNDCFTMTMMLEDFGRLDPVAIISNSSMSLHVKFNYVEALKCFKILKNCKVRSFNFYLKMNTLKSYIKKVYYKDIMLFNKAQEKSYISIDVLSHMTTYDHLVSLGPPLKPISFLDILKFSGSKDMFEYLLPKKTTVAKCVHYVNIMPFQDKLDVIFGNTIHALTGLLNIIGIHEFYSSTVTFSLPKPLTAISFLIYLQSIRDTDMDYYDRLMEYLEFIITMHILISTSIHSTKKPSGINTIRNVSEVEAIGRRIEDILSFSDKFAFAFRDFEAERDLCKEIVQSQDFITHNDKCRKFEPIEEPKL